MQFLLIVAGVKQSIESRGMLTTAQKTTLKAAIIANSTWNAFPNSEDGNFNLAELLSKEFPTPDYIVWKNSVTTKEVKNVIDWVEYLALTVTEKSTFELMISNGIIDPSNANIRAGIANIFDAQQSNTRNALIALGKRKATHIEKIFATGTGSDASPSVMGFEGKISGADVASARNS